MKSIPWWILPKSMAIAAGMVLGNHFAQAAAPDAQAPVLPVAGQIQASGTSADHEGSIAWHTSGGPAPEPVKTGHPTSWDACGGQNAYYYMASRDYAGIDPVSGGGIHCFNPAAGFPKLLAALGNNGFNITQLKAKYTMMSLGADAEGQDWGYDMNTKTETRRYQGGTFSFTLNGQPLVGGPMPEFCMVIKYDIGGIPCNDRISGYTGTVRPGDQSQGGPANVRAVAAAFLEDIGAGELRFVYDSFQPATQSEYTGGGRSGAFFDAMVGRVELIFRTTLTIDDARVVEGDNGAADAVFTVTLSQACQGDVKVDYTTADGTALSGSDYQATVGTLTIPAGQLSGTIRVPVFGDTIEEADETFLVNLANPVNAIIRDAQGQGTIVNDEQPRLTIDDVVVQEGNAGSSDAVFTVTLSRANPQAAVQVDFATSDGTATAGSDYTAVAGTMAIPAGQLTGTIRVPILGDGVVEPDETFFVDLNRPVNALILDGQGKGTIMNDDVAPPTLSIDDVRVVEGNAGLTRATFTVTLSRAIDQVVKFHFAVSDGTATLGEDFGNSSGDNLIQAGQTTVTLNVSVKGDTLVEPDETFFMTLSNPQNAALLRDMGIGTIVNDDQPMLANISIDDATCVEGNERTNLMFHVTLSGPSTVPVSVDYATTDGTAQVVDNDYAAASGTLTFAPGMTNLPVTVMVNGDTKVEPDETLFVHLSNPTNVLMLSPDGQGTILNDDSEGPIGIYIDDAAVSEGNTGFVQAQFQVMLSAPSAVPVSVDYATSDGTAVAGSDYVATNGTLVIPAGQTSAYIPVDVIGDVLVEPSEEHFYVSLSNATNAAIMLSPAEGTIVSDELPPFGGDNLPGEGPCVCTPLVMNWHYTGVENWFVKAAGGDMVIEFTAQTVNATDPERLQGRVYDSSGALVAEAYVSYTAAEAAKHPFSTNVQVTLAARTAGDVLRVEIRTPPPTLQTQTHYKLQFCGATEAGLNSPSFRGFEGDPGKWVFHVQAGEDLVVDLFTNRMPEPLAINKVLALIDPLGNMVMPPTVVPLGPGPEINVPSAIPGTWTLLVFRGPDDGFHYRLAKLTGADQGIYLNWRGAGGGIKRGVIYHNGQLATGIGYMVTMTPRFGDVDVVSTNANAALDTRMYQYTANGEFEFKNLPAGDYRVDVRPQTQGVSTPPPQFDRFFCNDVITNRFDTETVDVGISLDSMASITEGNSETTDVTLNVFLSQPRTVPVSVRYRTGDGDATAADADYLPSSGVVTFPSGITNQTITVKAVGDTKVEWDEHFYVELFQPTNAYLANWMSMVFIRNDDAALTLNINDAATVEGDRGQRAAVFTVSLSQPASQEVAVDFATADGMAQAGTDYRTNWGTIRFAPGSTSQTIAVRVNGDTLVESNETFFVDLSNPVNAMLDDPQGQGTILNDDQLAIEVGLTLQDVRVIEGNAGVSEAVFLAQLSSASGQTVTVHFATADGTATAGSDYVAASGDLVFASGETVKSIRVLVNGDTEVEPNETFFVNLDSPVNASLWKGQAAGTIINDDQAVALQIVKTSDRDAARPGELVQFTITAQNVGGASATGVTVRDILPSGLTFQSATVPAGGVFDTNRLEWTLRELAPAATVEMELTAQVASVADLARLFGILTNAAGANPPPLLILADVFGPVTNRATIGAAEMLQEAQMTATAVVRLVPPSLAGSVAGKSDGTFEFSAPAELDVVLLVQASDDMITWVTVGVIDPRTGETTFTESGMGAHRSRFYRIIPQ